MSLGVGLLVIAGLVAFWFGMTYNRFVCLRNMVKQAWSDIDVQLRRRHDLVPKLVSVVKGYAAHERQVLAEVTEQRARARVADRGDRGAAEADFAAGLHKLLALAENYPDLKADQGFLNLQHEISAVEDTIQMARRFYNGSVRLYNVQLESFPSLIVGKLMRYEPALYFDADDAEMESGVNE